MLRNHEITIRVRYDECDPMGFVHHSNYLKYMEMGRTELFRAAGGNYRDMETEGMLAVVIHVDCHYRKPGKYDDLLVVETTVAKLTVAKLVYAYVIRRGTEKLVTAEVTLALVNREGRLQMIPQSVFDFYGFER